MYSFDFTKASSIEEASKHLKTAGSQLIAGGQTLIPTLKQRLACPKKLVSLSRISEMNYVRINDSGEICIGGATSHFEVSKRAGKFPALAEMAGRIGDPAVRYRGTIGGSLANNDPAACYPSAVLASQAKVITDRRQITANDFFLGMFETVLAENEIIVEVRFPIPLVANYQKFVQPASRFALVGVFVAKDHTGVRVAVTGASENGVFRWMEAEEALEKNFSYKSIEKLKHENVDLISDIHASSDYRAHLVSVLTKRSILACR